MLRKDYVKMWTIPTLVKFIPKVGKVSFDSKKSHHRFDWEMLAVLYIRLTLYYE